MLDLPHSLRKGAPIDQGDFKSNFELQPMLNLFHSLRKRAPIDEGDIKSNISISLLMNQLKTDRFFVSDSASVGGGDESEILQKENPAVKNAFCRNAMQFSLQVLGAGKPKVVCQGRSTYHRSIMELYKICGTIGSSLPCSLEVDNSVNELRVSPRFDNPLRLPQGNNVCCRFLDNAKAIEFKLSYDCRLACSRRTGHNVSLHNCLKVLLTSSNVSKAGSSPEYGYILWADLARGPQATDRNQ
jgi:hypothetical protein